MDRLFVTGRGVYLPRVMHSNDSLPPLETPPSPEQLDRIGVVRRGWAGDDEGIAEMAAHAARAALARAGRGPDEIDLIILANWTQRRYIPEFAPKLQHALGAHRAFAFDVSGACTGFVLGIGAAHGFLQSERYRRALVVASETTSKRARPGSAATLVFGDGAAAWVLEPGADRGAEILDYELVTEGAYHHVMDINEQGHVKTHIPQRELNALAARSFAESSRRVLERNELRLDDVRWIVPHSGTAGIQATLIKTMEVAPDKVLSNFQVVGNVSSAAIPISLDHYLRDGRIREGDLVLSPTTGTGWYHAALLYRA